MTRNEMEAALAKAGFKLSEDGETWVSPGVDFRLEHIQGLELWELDQILAGVREGSDEIPLGDDRDFQIREEGA